MAVKITAKQQAFINGVLEGKSQREAYKAAYNCKRMSDKTIDEEACRLMSAPKVAARYAELMDKAASEAVATAQEVLESLTGIAMAGENEKTTDRLKALELLGKYHALFTEKQVQEGNMKLEICMSEELGAFSE